MADKIILISVEWGQEFSLQMNGAKPTAISARKEDNISSPPSPTITGQNLSGVSTFKLLRVQISSHLSWDAHIKCYALKDSAKDPLPQSCQKAGLPRDVLKQIYLTFILPALECASPVRGGLTKRPL